MVGTIRPRRVATFALLGALALALAACGGNYPNSTFNPNSEYNAAIDTLFDRLLYLGTAVFIVVEAALVYTIVRYRRRPGGALPKQVHGNTAIEIAWTAIPAVILIFVAIPTVRTIFITQSNAAPSALQVEVIGHQWWWEFRYPEYGITTANELYLPNGRTVNFQLKTNDVLHSFWIPQMGGKRDLISNRTNYLWFTPNKDLPSSAWNGYCAEFCGSSHANMKFRVYTVTPDEFTQWREHQVRPAIFPAPVATPAPAGAPGATALAPAAKVKGGAPIVQVANVQAANLQAVTSAAALVPEPPAWTFPMERIQKDFPHVVPQTPIPVGATFDEATLAKGDATRGMQIYSRSTCIGCHVVKGNPMSMGIVGPNLTHVATRHTIAAGLYPNDAKHLAYWIKNAQMMKPGAKMMVMGKGQYDPTTKLVTSVGGLTDAEIADIVAYLQALK